VLTDFDAEENMPGTMRAVVTHEWGDPEQLRVEEIPRPEAGEGELLVRVLAAGINPVDWKTRRNGGLMKSRGIEPPVILGWDVSGVVEAVGPGVEGFAVGDEVFGLGAFPKALGAYAEYAAVPAADVAVKPANISHAEAAALPLVALTAHQAFELADLQAGQLVLVHAAAGGVGSVAVQLAKARGARVAGTAGPANQEFLRELGVDIPIDYTTTDFADVLSDVDVVLESQGGDVRQRSWGVLRPGGIMVSILGPLPQEDAEAHNVRGVHMLVHTSGVQMAEIADLIAAGKLRSIVQQEFPLSAAPDAHRLAESGHVRGKLVLVP
jgi:NADPH:quinone reductase-like Zn-dependent oxidoreductase